MTVVLDRQVSGAVKAWKRGGAAGVREYAQSLTASEQVLVALELFNRRDLDVCAAFLTEEFVHDMRPVGVPGMEIFTGPGEYRRFLEEWLSVFPSAQVTVRAIEEAGDVVIATIQQKTTGSNSGVPVEFTYAAILSFRDGTPLNSEFHIDLESGRKRFEELTGS